MSIETGYYSVDWERLTRGLIEYGSLDFFFDALDDDEEENPSPDERVAWQDWIALPQQTLWENWRAAEELGRQIQSCPGLTEWRGLPELMRFLVGLAIVPHPEQDRFIPEAALGPPATLSDEYFGALDPPTVSEFLRIASQIVVSELSEIVVDSRTEDQPSHLPLLPRLVESYRVFLRDTESKGWGVILAAS